MVNKNIKNRHKTCYKSKNVPPKFASLISSEASSPPPKYSPYFFFPGFKADNHEILLK